MPRVAEDAAVAPVERRPRTIRKPEHLHASTAELAAARAVVAQVVAAVAVAR